MIIKNKIAVVIGARPQFIKHAPVELALRKYFEVISIHTGQHYDAKMSDIFFNQLNIATPQYMLNIGSHMHGRQTAIMLEKIEEILQSEMPVALLVYGDTNSTLAGALAASKLNLPVIHVEAGLRSFNKTMPEEINRILTDHVAELLFAPSVVAIDNLSNENIMKNVYNVGDVMCDSLQLALKYNRKQVNKIEPYFLCTLHRPYNTDDITRLIRILDELNRAIEKVIFPVHPRTMHILEKNGVKTSRFINIEFIEPVSYFDLIDLQQNAQCIITDSGGIQKEAYMLKKKCITLRTETEWVETLKDGWNTLVFDELEEIHAIIDAEPGEYIEKLYGDGQAAEKIAQIVDELFN